MDGGVLLTWMAPNVTNGVIQSYTVEVKLLNEDRHIVYIHNYTGLVSGTCTSCMHSIQHDMTNWYSIIT